MRPQVENDNRILREQYNTDFGAEEMLRDLKQLIKSAVRLGTGPSGPNPYNNKKGGGGDKKP
jgi:hypothetical protein